MPEERRLAAIMFTDIVGYTAIMGSDEDKAFDMLKRNHSIHETLINKYNGILIKEIGDGTLASFPLASDAVRCAMEIQREARDQDIPLKIGIHQGEMVMAGTDVLGDGVNVASRLQEASQDGCITISGKVYSDIRNKSGIITKYIGEKKLKNVDEPIKVYEVSSEKEEQKVQVDRSRKPRNKTLYYVIAGLTIIILAILVWQYYSAKEPPKITDQSGSVDIDRTIAVLPFVNDSPDQENEYFCNGMMEDILTNLQRISDLKVKSRRDVEQYRDNKKTITIIGAELGVSYILEGSVRKAGENLRITTQLIDAKTGDHLWANTYDGNYSDEIFKFQSEVAEMVASSLKAVMTPNEEVGLKKRPTAEISAYDYFSRGREEMLKYWNSLDIRRLRLAHKLLDKALEIDPQYLDAIGYKSGAYIAEQKYDSAYVYARRSFEIDPGSAASYYTMGEYYRVTQEYDAAISNYLLAVEHYKKGDIFPIYLTHVWIGYIYCAQKNDYLKGLPFIQKGLEGEYFVYHAYLGEIFTFLGDFNRAESHIDRMFELAPDFSSWYLVDISEKLFMQEKFNQALSFLDSICSITLNEEACNRQLFFANSYLSNSDKSEFYLKQFINDEIGPYDQTDSIWIVYKYLKVDKDQDAIQFLSNYKLSLENRLSGNQSNWILLNLAAVHAMLNEKEESLQYITQAVDLGQGSTYFNLLLYNPIFKDLRDEPEFKVILRRNKEKLEKVRAQINQMRERGEITF